MRALACTRGQSLKREGASRCAERKRAGEARRGEVECVGSCSARAHRSLHDARRYIGRYVQQRVRIKAAFERTKPSGGDDMSDVDVANTEDLVRIARRHARKPSDSNA